MEETYRHLRESWKTGERDREQALHLLFLAWMHWAEPDFVTGMSEDPRATELWHQVNAYFGQEDSSDAEFLYVAWIMGVITPWALGDEEDWQARAERMTARFLELRPDGLSPEHFEGRGAFGHYFAHQARANPTHA